MSNMKSCVSNYWKVLTALVEQLWIESMTSSRSNWRLFIQLMLKWLSAHLLKYWGLSFKLANSQIVSINRRRYVDDCIKNIPTGSEEQILQKFNEFHHKLEFSLELEKQSLINFMDLTLKRQRSKILTK